MWKIFAITHPQALHGKHSVYRFHPESLKMPLHEYFKLLKCDTLSWQSTVSVSIELIALTDLVDISIISNLVSLSVSILRPKRPRTYDDGPSTVVTDRIVRTWSEVARAGKGFKYLRALIFDCQAELTDQVFPYLNHFPALTVLVISGCPQINGEKALRTGAQHGWRTSAIDPHKCPFERLKEAYLNIKSAENLASQPGNALPTLHFRLENASLGHRSSTTTYLFRREQPAIGAEPGSAKAVRKSEINPSLTMRRPVRTLRIKSSRRKGMDGLLADFTR